VNELEQVERKATAGCLLPESRARDSRSVRRRPAQWAVGVLAHDV
jgi:hypothetical protein